MRKVENMNDHDHDDQCLACAAREILWSLPPMRAVGRLSRRFGRYDPRRR